MGSIFIQIIDRTCHWNAYENENENIENVSLTLQQQETQQKQKQNSKSHTETKLILSFMGKMVSNMIFD